jgi:hypothetical protein
MIVSQFPPRGPQSDLLDHVDGRGALMRETASEVSDAGLGAADAWGDCRRDLKGGTPAGS